MATADLADVAPETGIVWVYRFRPDGTAEVIANTDVDAALADQGAGWIWIHLALADMRCRNWIAQHAPVSELARECWAAPTRICGSISWAARSSACCPTCIRNWAGAARNWCACAL